MKIACFCVAAMDYFPQQKSSYPGGNALNQALWFRILGHEPAFIGALGTDEAGDRIEAMLKKAGVDTTHLARVEGETPSNQIVNDENGERFGVDGAWKNGVYGDYRLREEDWRYMADFDVWTTHVTGPNFEETLKRKSGTQLLAADFLHFQDYDVLERSLRSVDIAYFGGTQDMADELRRVAKKVGKPVVLTLGKDGSMAFVGDRVFTQKALPLAKVVDTTGCGDAFQAGFTASYAQKQNAAQALLAGAELGRRAADHFGGVPQL